VSPELQNALELLESKAGIEASEARLAGLPFAVRFRQILFVIHQKICPRAHEIQKTMESDELSLGTVLCDVLVSSFSGLPAPCATISQQIARVGLKRFCASPVSLLSLRERMISEDDVLFEAFAREYGSPAGEHYDVDDPVAVARTAGFAAAVRTTRYDFQQSEEPLEDIAIRESMTARSKDGIAIQTGIVLSNYPNGIAVKRGDRYITALLFPMPHVLFDVVDAMCANNAFFPSIGEFTPAPDACYSGALMPGLRPLRRMQQAFTRSHTAESLQSFMREEHEEQHFVRQSIQTFDAARYNLRVMLRSLCMKAIWEHEMAHIRCGHLDYLAHGVSATALSENGLIGKIDPDMMRLRQYMEFEADTRAAHAVVTDAFMMSRSPSFAKTYSVDPGEHVLVAATAAMLVSYTLSSISEMFHTPQSPFYPDHSMRSQATDMGVLAALGEADSRVEESETITRYVTKEYYNRLSGLAKTHASIKAWMSRMVTSNAEGEAYLARLINECREPIQEMNAMRPFG
tara:strand:+ start:7381 stop:8931 length:1551 start_codon:yes stop_codon:yes gene_type:complete